MDLSKYVINIYIKHVNILLLITFCYIYLTNSKPYVWLIICCVSLIPLLVTVPMHLKWFIKPHLEQIKEESKEEKEE